MILYTSALSPFGRKVRIVAHALGLADRLTLQNQGVSPVNPDPEFLRKNPLGKIPALVTDDGVALFDSHVIVDYLLALAPEAAAALVPPGIEGWQVRTRQALASGMTDAVILARYESALRPEALRWSEWLDGQMRKFDEGLAAFEAAFSSPEFRWTLDAMALAACLAYADARFPDLGWRDRAPSLARWFEIAKEHPSFLASLTE